MADLEVKLCQPTISAENRRSDDFGTPRSADNCKGESFFRSAIHAIELMKHPLESRPCLKLSRCFLHLRDSLERKPVLSVLLNDQFGMHVMRCAPLRILFSDAENRGTNTSKISRFQRSNLSNDYLWVPFPFLPSP